jgi:signal transduction histidine kinase
MHFIIVQSILSVFILGALVFTFCYHISMYMAHKDKLLLHYIFYLFFATFYCIQLTEFPELILGERIATFVRHHFNESNQILYLTFYFNFILQSINVTQNKKSFLFRAWVVIMFVLIGYAILEGILYVFVKNFINAIGFYAIRAFIFILTGIMLYQCFKLRNITFQRYILIGCSVYFVFGITSFVSNIDFDGMSLISPPEWLLLGTFFDIVFFSYAIGYRNKKIVQDYNIVQLEDAKKIIAMQKLVLEKQTVLENDRSRIASDMHDDIGSGLTKITYLSQMALNNFDNNDKLLKIKETAAVLVENMSEIIWAMKEENNSLEDLINYIKSYAVDYFDSNHTQLQIKVSGFYDNIEISGDSRRHIFLSIKESLNNIIKHANAKNAFIEIKINEFLNITIKDNGSGFDTKNIRKEGNGLHNIRKRISKLKGVVNYDANNGTVINFEIPMQNLIA